eukprot:3103856-Rhodomonas_salina.2
MAFYHPTLSASERILGTSETEDRAHLCRYRLFAPPPSCAPRSAWASGRPSAHDVSIGQRGEVKWERTSEPLKCRALSAFDIVRARQSTVPWRKA